jgi:hypothetical protein
MHSLLRSSAQALAWVPVERLARIKRWMREHRSQRPVEYHCFDAVLTLWLIGAVGLLPSLILLQWAALPVCVVLMFAPRLYLRCRARWHQNGLLRCDWFACISAYH